MEVLDVVIDFETRSRATLTKRSTKKESPTNFFRVSPGTTNAYHYARHPSTEVLCMSHKVDLNPPELWVPGQPFPLDDVWPYCRLLAHNLEFEWEIWENVCVPRYGWPSITQVPTECTAARAAYYGLPRKLDFISKPMGFRRLAKDKAGHNVMHQLCRPFGGELVGCEYVGGEFDNDPEKHQINFDYCLQDAVAEYVVGSECGPLPPFEAATWSAHRDINARGVPIDRKLCEYAVYASNREEVRLTHQLQGITGDTSATVDDLPKIKDWIDEQGVSDEWPRTKNGSLQLTEQTLKDSLKGKYGELPKQVEAVLNIRALSRDASTAKYHAFLRHADSDDRCRGLLQYGEAGTLRWSSRGPQPQNQKRLSDANAMCQQADRLTSFPDAESAYQDLYQQTKGEVIPALGSMIRMAVTAKPGHVLAVADFSAIEMRVLHWLAGDEPTLKTLRDFDNGVGEDPYKIMGASIYGKPAAGLTKEERQIGKIATLGGGYLQGPQSYRAFCSGYGVKVDMEEAKEHVQLYRRSFPLVKKFWYTIQDAVLDTLKTGRPNEVGYLRFYMLGNTFSVRLPSGREMRYFDARIEDGDFGLELTAQSVKHTGRRKVGLPVLVENLVQAIARDLLALSLIRCRQTGLPVVLHVHDEIVIEVLEDRAVSSLNRLKGIMSDVPGWAPGLPLAVEGGFNRRYSK